MEVLDSPKVDEDQWQFNVDIRKELRRLATIDDQPAQVTAELGTELAQAQGVTGQRGAVSRARSVWGGE